MHPAVRSVSALRDTVEPPALGGNTMSRFTLVFVLATGCGGSRPVEQPADPPVAPPELIQGTMPGSDAVSGGPDAEAAADAPQAEGEPPAPPRGESVSLADGTAAYRTGPAEVTGQTPAVLVVHGQSGLDERIKRHADELADGGHLVLAVDLYGEAPADAGAETRWAAVDPAVAAGRIQTALQSLRTPEDRKIGLLGWEAAGALALDAALAAPDLDAVVVEGVTLDANPAALATLQAPLLALQGTQGPDMGPERLDALDAALAAAGKDVVIKRFDANAAFTDPASAGHAPQQSAAAWKETKDFLQARLSK